jgi:hypothetical protein
VRAAIAKAGVGLFVLPLYSPDMNPIAMAFAKLKTLLRQAPDAPLMGSGDASAPCSATSPRMKASTTSKRPDIATHSENALAFGNAHGTSNVCRYECCTPEHLPPKIESSGHCRAEPSPTVLPGPLSSRSVPDALAHFISASTPA